MVRLTTTRGNTMKGTLILLALAALLPSAASGDNLDFSYLEAGLSHSSLRNYAGGNGYAIDGAYALTDTLFLDGHIEHSSFKDNTVLSPFGTTLGSITLDRDAAHLGMKFPMNEAVDVLFRLGVTRLTVDNEFDPNDNLTSYDLGLGLRADLGAGFELEADIGQNQAAFGYFESSNLIGVEATDGNETSATVAFRYHVIDRFMVGLSYGLRHDNPGHGDTSSDMHTWLLSARWAF
jgi:hypothetical protein